MALPSTSTCLGGRVFLSGFPSRRFEVRGFSILLEEWSTRASSLVNPDLIGFRAPTACLLTTRIIDEQPLDVNVSGGDLTISVRVQA